MLDNAVNETGKAEVHLIGIYLRHVSLEIGQSPLPSREGINPEIRLELNVQINALGEQDEVILNFGLTGRG